MKLTYKVGDKMVNNIADAIEEYILKQLSEKENGEVILKRTELADKIACAPSQISYVLSTRFTSDRGFEVESRRGLGGYIRITIVEGTAIRKIIFEDILRKIEPDSECDYICSMVDYLMKNRFITKREAVLCVQFIMNLFRIRKLEPEERVRLLKSMFVTLSSF